MKHGIKTPYDRNTPDWPIIHVRRQSISSDQLFPAWINVKEKVQFNLLPWDPRIGCNGQITECGSWGYRPIQVGSHMNVKTCRMFHNLYMVCHVTPDLVGKVCLTYLEFRLPSKGQASAQFSDWGYTHSSGLPHQFQTHIRCFAAHIWCGYAYVVALPH